MKIFLEGMDFYAYHGAYKEENLLGQRFIVDIEIECDFPFEDDLKYTVDYTEIYKKTKDIVENFKFKLIETLAIEIGKRVLEDKKIKKVLVRVEKPSPPIKGILDKVGVQIELENDSNIL
jgi:dihydroneopterin aldolase